MIYNFSEPSINQIDCDNPTERIHRPDVRFWFPIIDPVYTPASENNIVTILLHNNSQSSWSHNDELLVHSKSINHTTQIGFWVRTDIHSWQ